MQGTFPFTYQAYVTMLDMLRDHGYTFSDYHKWEEFDKPVILRHDVDSSPEKALQLAKLENKRGVHSTFFVLLTTDFYNVFSERTHECFKEISKLGHEIGLHFDETRYPESFGDPSKNREHIIHEAAILGETLGTPIATVSMHRPSKQMLEADLYIPGIINSYGKTFFHDFKYLSDSRHHWREPVADIIAAGTCPKLHILTHAVAWADEEKNLQEWVRGFMRDQMRTRWNVLNDNFTDLQSVLPYEEICQWLRE